MKGRPLVSGSFILRSKGQCSIAVHCTLAVTIVNCKWYYTQ